MQTQKPVASSPCYEYSQVFGLTLSVTSEQVSQTFHSQVKKIIFMCECTMIPQSHSDMIHINNRQTMVYGETRQ